MSILDIFVKAAFLSVFLLSFSCGAAGQKTQTEKPTNQTAVAAQTKEDKPEIIRGANAEFTTKDITQNRDVTRYDDGGYFDCRGYVMKNEPRGECSENKLRDFIWEHWTGKKRGYVRVTYDSVDAISTSHIFIEPGANDEWKVEWRIVRGVAIPGYGNRIDDVLGIVAVERVENKPERGQWALVFKNKAGKVLQTMPDFYYE